MESYLKDPCRALSIPLWKWKRISVPDGMEIVHDSMFSKDKYVGVADERYFRLSRTFADVQKFGLDEYEVRTVSENDIAEVVDNINRSYLDLQVSVSQMVSYTNTPVFNQNLWILVCEKETGICVGSGIADYDAEAGELILEWIQVLPEYRRRNIGKLIVNELLWRGKDYASFATVSGKKDDPINPETLYRACGFSGNDIWHILIKK